MGGSGALWASGLGWAGPGNWTRSHLTNEGGRAGKGWLGRVGRAAYKSSWYAPALLCSFSSLSVRLGLSRDALGEHTQAKAESRRRRRRLLIDDCVMSQKLVQSEEGRQQVGRQQPADTSTAPCVLMLLVSVRACVSQGWCRLILVSNWLSCLVLGAWSWEDYWCAARNCTIDQDPSDNGRVGWAVSFPFRPVQAARAMPTITEYSTYERITVAARAVCQLLTACLGRC